MGLKYYISYNMDLFEVYEENVDMNLTPSDRSSNFTNAEIEKLKKLISKYAKVILNKKTNGLSIKQKVETWEIIAKEYNASSNTYRSVKQLKCKWEYMKKSARKEAGKVYRMWRQTGGGPPPPPLSMTNEWVAGILKESASGIDSQYDGDVCTNIVVEPPQTPVYATVNVLDLCTNVDEEHNIFKENVEQPSTPVSSTNRPTPTARKVLNATPHQTRQSFLELANKKKELVELKAKKIESKDDTTLVRLKEEKCRLEMELLQKSYENDEKRKQEIHEPQVLKLKLEIEILNKKTQ